MKKVLLLHIFICISILPMTAAENKTIITVLDFSSEGVSESEMKSIINYLSSSLFKTGKFTVIDVSQRENILNELEFSMSGCTDESCYLEVGKMLSAEGIVVGSLGRVGSRFLLTAKLLETETGATKSSADGMYKDLDGLLDDISRISAELGSIYEQSAPVEVVITESENNTQLTPPESDAAAEQKPKVSLDINLPAWGSLAGAVGCLGAGGYFLGVSLPLLIDYMQTKSAYDAATESAAAAELYTAADAARVAAVDGKVNTYLPLGAGLAAAGVGLGVLSIVLFSSPKNAEMPIETAMYPVSGGMQLRFMVHPRERF